MSTVYEFKKEDAYAFADMQHCRKWLKGNELVFEYCPLCQGGPSRDKETFAININNGAYNCKRSTCNARGPFIQLARIFKMSLGTVADDYYAPPKIELKKFKLPEKNPNDAAKEYLHNRGISDAVIEKYEVKLSDKNEHQIAFPCRTAKGEITAIKYRALPGYEFPDGSKEKFKTGSATNALFGAWQCNLKNKTFILTEGQFDAMSIAEAGYENPVSVIGGCQNYHWIGPFWDWMHNFETLIVFGDYEKGHVTLYDQVKGFKFLGVKKVREEDYLDCKDANDILRKYGKDQIRKCIENAEPVPISHIKQLADVERLNLNQIKKLKTYFPKIDNALKGGLPFGGVTIIAGKTGEGKSTLANQICAGAIAEGIPIFIYSGELMNKIFKNWFYFQIAGPAYLEKRNNDILLNDAYFRMIDSWCKDRAYIYDNEIVENGDEASSLLAVMEEVCLRYRVKVFLIDNLMTAIDLNLTPGTDDYSRQSNFVKKLTVFAIQNDALVLLVAHKRKNSSGDDDENENDEVAGSSNITNLAMVTLGLRKPNKNKETEKNMPDNKRFMSISKNRLFGTTVRGIEVTYDWDSRRLYTSKEELYRQYGWEKIFTKEQEQVNDGFIISGEGNPFEEE